MPAVTAIGDITIIAGLEKSIHLSEKKSAEWQIAVLQNRTAPGVLKTGGYYELINRLERKSIRKGYG